MLRYIVFVEDSREAKKKFVEKSIGFWVPIRIGQVIFGDEPVGVDDPDSLIFTQIMQLCNCDNDFLKIETIRTKPTKPEDLVDVGYVISSSDFEKITRRLM